MKKKKKKKNPITKRDWWSYSRYRPWVQNPIPQKKIKSKMDWRCGSSSRVPALEVWTLEYKPKFHQKKRKCRHNSIVIVVTIYNLFVMLGIEHSRQVLYHWATCQPHGRDLKAVLNTSDWETFLNIVCLQWTF
jgi:hypothetical protein